MTARTHHTLALHHAAGFGHVFAHDEAASKSFTHVCILLRLAAAYSCGVIPLAPAKERVNTARC